MTPDEERDAWIRSGAAELTGRPGGPSLDPPPGFVGRLHAVARDLADLTGTVGRRVEVDPLEVICQRAAIAGLRRGGDVSCGGATRLLPTLDDQWLAISLARPDDWALLAALFESAPVEEEDWDTVTRAVACRSAAELVERGATLLGLPMALLAGTAASPHVPGWDTSPGRAADRPARTIEDVVVADLSTMWAGPLAGSLLAAAGAQVVKVESTARPDGTRAGPPDLFDLLNGAKRPVALDLGDSDGRRELHALVATADVVITSSRARALDQLGLSPDELVHGDGRPQVWLAVSGHGVAGAGAERVAFGDDAAVAGGLVVADEHGPCFCADAVADPLTGLVGATEVVAALAAGRPAVVDLAMARIAARFAGRT